MRRQPIFSGGVAVFCALCVGLTWGTAIVVRADDAASLAHVQEPVPPPPTLESLAREVFQIVQKNCIECHGEAREAQLDLRTEAGLQKGGRSGPVVVAKDPAASLLYKAVTHDGDLQMPEDAPKLSDATIRTIKLWIEAGASWASVPAAGGGGF